MPLSTFNAVRMPLSDRPSSTSVIATAGCIPTSTVSASSRLAMPAMLASILSDKRIDDLQRRDVDQDAARASFDDSFREILLQGHGEAVMHVHLDGDQQELTHLQDGNSVHGQTTSAVRRSPRLSLTTDMPDRRNATANASANVAFVVTFVGPHPDE